MPQAPSVQSITPDQTSYTRGEKVTLTVQYTPGYSDLENNATYQVTDENTNLTGELSVPYVVEDAIKDPTTGSFTDTMGNQYTLVSDNGSTAVWTTTLPS